MALHFIVFKDDRYWKPNPHYIRAVGAPDFCHRAWDARAGADIVSSDKVVWANYGEGLAACLPPFLHHTFDDSRQDIIANGDEKGVDYEQTGPRQADQGHHPDRGGQGHPRGGRRGRAGKI